MASLAKVPEDAVCDTIDIDDFIIGDSVDMSTGRFARQSHVLDFTNRPKKWKTLGDAVAAHVQPAGLAAQLQGTAFTASVATLTADSAVRPHHQRECAPRACTYAN